MNVEDLYLSYLYTVKSLGISESTMLLCASITSQKLYLLKKGKSVKEYVMSSSRRPPSCKENSLGTPWGLHEICEKIREGEDLGMVFEGRKSIGMTHSECNEEKRAKNLITTRILRLKGLQVGVNQGDGVDSFDRYIYIHGTNHEDRLGQPSSSGCLQLSNSDVLELHNNVNEGTHLWIEKIAND